MDKSEQSKFKYILSPENAYIIEYADFSLEVLGSEIMRIVREATHLDDLLPSKEKPSDLI